jgi:hypothetical protein
MGSVIPFAARKAAGDEHEDRVREQLEKRGWTVSPYGQRILAEEIRRALKRTESPARWDPDFVVACGSTIRYVDAKGSLRGMNADLNFISRRALEAHRRLQSDRDIPVFYVFGDLGVMTPDEVLRAAEVERLGTAGGYLSVPRDASRKLDDVFGPVHPPTWGADPLFKVA